MSSLDKTRVWPFLVQCSGEQNQRLSHTLITVYFRVFWLCERFGDSVALHYIHCFETVASDISGIGSQWPFVVESDEMKHKLCFDRQVWNLQSNKFARQDNNQNNSGVHCSSLDGNNISSSTVTRRISMVAVDEDRVENIRSLQRLWWNQRLVIKVA